MDYEEILKETGLRHSSDEQPGFKRRRYGKGFVYRDENDEKIVDKKIIERIKKIGIPPNWTEVWICKSEKGHIQAIGRDASNRKQYLYHESWTLAQQENKFHKLIEFAHFLPKIRETVKKDLRKKAWPKEKVIALVVAILDETYVRIGNKQYYELNGTHGLTTLRRKNLKINGKSITFNYKGKSNKFRELTITNKRLVRLIKECSELRGYEVFRYLGENGQTIPVDSSDVNNYLREITGENFTSKNFRTWGGSVLAVKSYQSALEKVQRNKKLKMKSAIVKAVADELNNTVTVCEKYYIHPSILAALHENYNPDEYSLKDINVDLDEEEKIALAIITEGMPRS